MRMTTGKGQDIAERLAEAFDRVADQNKPAGLTDSWALFQARNAWGIFLTTRQCLKVGKMARAAYAMREAVKGWKR